MNTMFDSLVPDISGNSSLAWRFWCAVEVLPNSVCRIDNYSACLKMNKSNHLECCGATRVTNCLPARM